jgi:transglutaminase-like putative cysteine protease
MWLRIEHTTRFTYDAPISEAYSEVRLKPLHRDAQRCSSFSIVTEPRNSELHEYVDRLGNTVHHFDVLERHDALAVTVLAEVLTPAAFAPGTAQLSLVDRWEFTRPTRYVPTGGAIAELAAAAQEGGGNAATAHEIVRAVRGAMTYEPGSTTVHTTADEALGEGRGVCQDFAHVMIGCCRARGIPARYVSGYLYDPASPGNGDAGASHAWLDVYDEARGWVSLDPTHDTEQTEHYVRIAVDRDYADVPPTRGVYKGDASEELEVAVRIEPH